MIALSKLYFNFILKKEHMVARRRHSSSKAIASRSLKGKFPRMFAQNNHVWRYHYA